MASKVPFEIKISEWFHTAPPADAQREFQRIRYVMHSRGLLKRGASKAAKRIGRAASPVGVGAPLSVGGTDAAD